MSLSIEDAKRQFSIKFLGTYTINGIGIGEEDGTPAIVVLAVSMKTARQAIGDEYEGHPVVYRPTTGAVALEESASSES